MRSMAYVIEQLPLYVLDALEPDEARELERQLRRCRVCRDEVAAYRRVVPSRASASMRL